MTPDCEKRTAVVFEHRGLAHHVDRAVRRRARLAAEIVDEARRPFGAGQLHRQRRLVAIARLRESVQRVLGHVHPCVRWCSESAALRASARSGRSRSMPQNGSPSTMMNGEPNTPAAIARFYFALEGILEHRDHRRRHAPRRRRSPPRPATSAAMSALRDVEALDTKNARYSAFAARVRLPSPPCCFAHSTMRDGACAGNRETQAAC